MSYYYDNYCNYEEINDDNHSGCASQSNDVEWDPPSELDYHHHNQELTPFNLNHHNQEPTSSRYHHDNPTYPETAHKLAYRHNELEHQENGGSCRENE